MITNSVMMFVYQDPTTAITMKPDDLFGDDICQDPTTVESTKSQLKDLVKILLNKIQLYLRRLIFLRKIALKT